MGIGDSERLARIEEKVDAIYHSVKHMREDVKTVEGRVWQALLLAAIALLGTVLAVATR